MATEETQYVALRDFVFSQGGEHVEVTEGQECPALGEGRVATLLRQKWIAPAGEVDSAPDEEEGDTDQGDWKESPVDQLDVEPRIRQALAEAGLGTVAELLAYGAEHGTLTEIDGIGEASEKAIQEAIAKLAQ